MPASQKRFPLATIDLGAHSCRLLIAEYVPGSEKPVILEELSVSIPLGADVFRHGAISDTAIRMLCNIFSNFRNKLNEYGIRHYRAIATSAVREAANAPVLLERIRHATGITVTLFEGTDEARLNYLTLANVLPAKLEFHRKSSLIADIGTGACQISAYKDGAFCFTETIKLGTLRVLEQIPGIISAEGIWKYLTPVIDKAFTELRQIASNIRSRNLFAMGGSVRALLYLFGSPDSREEVRKVRRKDFEEKMISLRSMSLENLSDTYNIPADLAETVIPCAIIIDNLFRITGATTLIVPTVTMKQGLLLDFMRELLKKNDAFTRQIEEMVRMTAEKYRAGNDFTRRTALFAEKLFCQLQQLHGCSLRESLLLRIAAHLHKTGLFINNQSYHIHSGYIIRSTEIPGISQQERQIAALTARYHRRQTPDLHPQDMEHLPADARSSVLKLSALLRIACALAESCRSVTQFQIRIEPERVVLVPSPDLQLTGLAIPEQDVAYFRRVFAMPLLVK